ncbi:MAG: MBL fold metallo-hydrolase, partial [Dehalococcoidia bacterium]
RKAHHGDKLIAAGAEVVVHEIPVTGEPNAFFEAGGLVLESFEVNHFPVVPALGFRARFGGRSVVFSGDTTDCPGLRTASLGAQMLVCEAINTALIEAWATGLHAGGRTNQAELLRDVPSYHIPTLTVAEVARDCGVGELVLTHLIPPVPADSAREAVFVAGMQAIYPGPIRVARDGMRVALTEAPATA